MCWEAERVWIWQVSADLKPQASGFSDAGDTQRKMGELNMDDLLGLTDTIEEEGESPDTASDPFAVCLAIQNECSRLVLEGNNEILRLVTGYKAALF